MLAAPPIITTVAAQPTAVIRLNIPRAAMQTEMGPAIGELMRTLAAQHVAPSGPLFSRHFAMHDDRFDFEVGVPVDAPFEPVGRVVASSLPAAKVARAVLEGDYGGLAQGWAALLGWIEAHRFPVEAGLWEVYLAGPQADPDPASWRTQLNKPLSN